MLPVITLFKNEFLEYYRLCDQLGIRPHEVDECEFFYTFRPSSAKLPAMLKVLKENGVIHGVQFESRKSSASKVNRNNRQSQLIEI